MCQNNTNEPSFMHHSVKNALGLMLVREVAFESQTRQKKIFYAFFTTTLGPIFLVAMCSTTIYTIACGLTTIQLVLKVVFTP